jgi:Ca2+-binding RTX toxin-like protein
VAIRDVAVNYTTVDGTAVAGTDYTASAGTLTFPAGVTSLQIAVTVLDDSIFENPEAFTVQLSNAVFDPADAAEPLEISDDSGEGHIIDDGQLTALDLDLHVADEPVNLVIVLDKSGSMVADPGVEGFATRFDLAREAVRQLLDGYNQNSDVNVLMVDFSSGNLTYNSGWLTLPDALAYLEAIEVRGFTDYQEALLQVREAFNAPDDPAPTASETFIYFLSDGDPQGRGGALDGALTSDDVIAWEAFLGDPANHITRAYAVGIGDGLRPLDDDRNQLDEVAFPNGESDNPAILTEAELIPNLLATVQEQSVSGNLVTETGFETAFSTEGVRLLSLEVDGITYRYDADTDQITGGTSGPVTGSVLTVVTGLGGELGFDFANGDYSYVIPRVETDSQESFAYSVINTNGLTDSASFTVHVTAISEAAPVSEVSGGAGVDVIYGSAGNDILNGGDGDDILIGALGADELTGGSGADTFVIRSLAEGLDNIIDFNPDEQDVLDLSGLLAGSDPDDVLANIGNYVSALAGETGTSLAVDPEGSGLFADAEIATLSSVTTGQLNILIGEDTQVTLDIV